MKTPHLPIVNIPLVTELIVQSPAAPIVPVTATETAPVTAAEETVMTVESTKHGLFFIKYVLFLNSIGLTQLN